MFRFSRICLLTALLLGLPALGEAPVPVEWTVQLQGENLLIDAKTGATGPAQRASGNYLELTFPKSKLAGSALSKAIDRGLVQRVQTLQDSDGASVRVFFLNKPKATLSKTATGFRYTVRTSEPAGSPAAARPKPSAEDAPAAVEPPATAQPPVAAQPPAASKPPVVAQPPAASKPPVVAQPPAASKPPVVAQPPAASKPPVVAQPPAASKPPVVAQPPAASTPPVVAQPPAASKPPVAVAAQPPATRGPQTLITVVFKDEPLANAIKEMAAQAGYTAQVDSKLSGVVNLSLSEVPFEQALKMLLEPYGKNVELQLGATSIVVTRTVAAATPTRSADPGAAPAGNIVYEYYPFASKDAQKMMEAVRKAIPELSYRVDPVLNILLVQGPREDVVRLGELLKSMSNK